MWTSALLLAVAVVATTTAYPTQAEIERILAPVARAAADKYNCSIAIGFSSKNTTASVAKGAVGGGKQAAPSDKYVWGSVTKVMTGATILKLVSEGKISLDDSVPKLVDPFFARAKPFNYTSCEDLWGKEVNDVTIRDLLAMESGIPDFDTAKGEGKEMTDPFRADVYEHKEHYFTPLELLNLGWVHTGNLTQKPGPNCGKSFCQSYSSTNFMLLGIILAEQYGAAAWDTFDQTVLFPPSLKEKYTGLDFGNTGSPSVYTPVHGFDRTHYNGQSGEGEGVSVWNVDGVFCGWTASNIIGTVQHLADLTYDLYGKEYRFIPKKYVDMMIPTGPFYGLATFNLSRRTGPLATKLGFGRAYGHLGATYGYQSTVTYHEALDFSLAIASNIERDYQDQPSYVLCFVYNQLMAAIQGLPPPTCKYDLKSYYSSSCNCTI